MAGETGTGYRHITVAKLRKLLAMLRDDDELVPNALGNLVIMRDGSYNGYIEILFERMEWHDEESH